MDLDTANGGADGEPTVQSTNSIFGSQLDNLQRAMSRTTQRQAMLSNNMANVNTPGFKRKDIDFNITLQDATTAGEAHLQQMREDQAQQESDQTSQRTDGNNVDMEREIVSMSETELRFQALSQMTASYLSSLVSVIREGK